MVERVAPNVQMRRRRSNSTANIYIHIHYPILAIYSKHVLIPTTDAVILKVLIPNTLHAIDSDRRSHTNRQNCYRK